MSELERWNQLDTRLARVRYVGDPSEVGHDYSTLAAAISTIGGSSVTLIVPPGLDAAAYVAGGVTVPVNVSLKVQKGAMLTVATGATLIMNGSLDAGLYKVFSCAGTGKVVFNFGSVPKIFPQWWGARGDGETDDTAAIDAMWTSFVNSESHAETWPKLSMRTPAIHFPAGDYLYSTGSGLTWTGSKQLIMRGDGVASTRINLPSGVYFLSVEYADYVHWSNMTVKGGKGGFRQSGTSTNVHGFLTFSNLRLEDYTECGLGFNAADKPYVQVHSCTLYGSSAISSIGVAMAGQPDGGEILGSDFGRNKYHIKAKTAGNCMLIQGNSFLRLGAPYGSPAHDIWLVPDSSYTNAAARILSNKFGNEGLSTTATDFRILLADEDTGSGTDNLSRHHSTNSSTGFVNLLQVIGNFFAGAGANPSDNKPYIYSYTKNVIGLVFDNLLYETIPTNLIEYSQTLAETDYDCRENIFTVRSMAFGKNINPGLSNRFGVGLVEDPLGYRQGREDAPHFYQAGGRGIDYIRVLVNDHADTNGTVGSATKTAATDALGGNNAVTVDYSASTGFWLVNAANPSAAVAGKHAWIEFDLKKAASNPLTEVVVYLTDVNGFSGMLLVRKVKVPDNWLRVRFSFVPRASQGYLQLVVCPVGYSEGVTDRVIVGRPAIYHALEPVNFRESWGSFTVTQNQATTTVTDAFATNVSKINISPTASASATEATGTYVSAKAHGSFTVTHPNNATAGRTWDYQIRN